MFFVASLLRFCEWGLKEEDGTYLECYPAGPSQKHVFFKVGPPPDYQACLMLVTSRPTESFKGCWKRYIFEGGYCLD
jgi:hypothetical protein